MNGIITDIFRTSIVDGPGIRTTVFLKGCQLRCIWCHNPETQSMKIEKDYGRLIDSETIVAECVKDRIYYDETDGGVTLSGGEPLMQPDFALEILKRLKELGIHTTLDTTGVAKISIYKKALKVTDLFLFDYKVTDSKSHFSLTGSRKEPIMDTFNFLISNNAKIILRCPMIPGVNDEVEHLTTISEMEFKYPSLVEINILPYHTMGNAKYEKLGRPVDPSLPKENIPNKLKEYYLSFFKIRGNKKVILKD